MTYYTYLWLREDGTPYYVGKGKGRRGFYLGSHLGKPPKDESRILIQNHESEDDAYEAEIFLISFYGRVDLGTGCLRNRADGGRLSNGNKGKKLRPEWRAKIAASLIGNKHTLGRKASPEERAKMSAARKGKPSGREGCTLTEAHKKLCSERLRGRVFSDEHRKNLAEAVRKIAKFRKQPVRPEGYFLNMNLKANHKRHHERTGKFNAACELCRIHIPPSTQQELFA